MKWTEIELNGAQPLLFGGEKIGTVKRQEMSDRIDGLKVCFDTGARVELRQAVDVSQRLECPRVFAIEGGPRETFLLFGGEKFYWLSSAGKVQAESSLFRNQRETEYWTTEILEQNGVVIVIYEAGVLAIDDALKVRWHKPKLLNDDFLCIENDALKFARDHDEKWFMRLEDGESSQQLPPPLLA